MNSTRVACYSLLASAFLLAGLLFSQLGHRVGDAAYGDMVATQQKITVLTAETRNGHESLFVLDQTNGALLIYNPSVTDRRLTLMQAISAQQIFAGGGGGGTGR